MTFLEKLTAHKGGLVLLRSDLFWYGGRGWDGARDRVCLLMDTATSRPAAAAATRTAAAATTRTAAAATTTVVRPAALLLVDGQPHWVRVAQADVELL